MFHIGHLNLLKRAKALGDYLIVAVSSDEFNAIKGKKTIIPFDQRVEIVRNIKCVDEVIREDSWDQKINDIKEHDVDVFVMGDDWKGKFDFLRKYCDVIYLPRTKNISTTLLKNDIHKLNKFYTALKSVYSKDLMKAMEEIIQFMKELR